MNSAEISHEATAVYLYCLSPAQSLISTAALANNDQPGVDERYPLAALMVGDIAAVIGQIEIKDFSESNLQTLEWVATRAFQHEAIVEHVMAHATVLPVKFGTIFDSQTSLMNFVVAHEESIAHALVKLQAQTEWSVKAYLKQEQAETLVCARDQAIQEKISNLADSPGVRYLQQRQLAIHIKSAVQAWLDDLCAEIKVSLLGVAEEAFDLRCHSNTVTGREEAMVFNCSFLVADSALSLFKSAFASLRLRHAPAGMGLELRGPWPPYNFCPTLTKVPR